MCVKRVITVFLLLLCFLVPNVAALENLDLITQWLSVSGTFSTNDKANSLDGDNATQWISGGEHPNWYKFDFPSAREITRVSFNNYGGEQNGIYTFLWQHSDDNSVWITAHEKTSVGGVVYNYSFINESMGTHKYWRLYDIHRDTGTNYAIIEQFYAWNGTEEAPEPTTNTLLLNLSKEVIDFVVDENENFYVSTNFTLEETILVGGVCNFTAYNISAHFVEESSVNYTINLSTDILVLNVAEGNTSVLNDVVEFSVCRENLKTDLQILKDGVLHKTLDQNIIPLCSVGSHLETESTTSFLNDSNIDISLVCPSCNGGNRVLRIVSVLGERLHFERSFEHHLSLIHI